MNDKAKSLATEFPEIAAEWDFDKNYPLTPNKVTYKSGKSVFWVCPLGHSYETDIDKRTVQNVGCPYCANKKVLPGFNDLQSKFPALSVEWGREKNEGLLPSNIVFGSNKKVWWTCKNGHSYMASVAQRVRLKSACPYCAGQVAISGETDLRTMFPDVVEYWDYSANGDKHPEQFLPKSSEHINWMCRKCGSKWNTTIKNMVNRKCKCKVCRENGE